MSESSGSRPRLARIALFPVKSLDAISVETVHLLAGGGLEHDRQFAIRDEQGRFVNGKRTDRVHRLRSVCDWVARRVTFRIDDRPGSVSFSIDDDRADLDGWLSDYFSMPVTFVEDTAYGFPDDTDAPGPTVVSTATLEAVTEWFPEIDLAEARRRFRANLEIGGTEPFWEDRLYTEEGSTVAFQIGGITLAGSNPCARCVVPSRDAATGERIDRFRERFMEHRRRTLPDWAERSRFNHFYRLAVNTRRLDTAETRDADSASAAALQVGQTVRILGPRAM